MNKNPVDTVKSEKEATNLIELQSAEFKRGISAGILMTDFSQFADNGCS